MINYKINEPVGLAQVLYLFKHSGIIRPVDDEARINKMNRRWDLLITAWDGELLVGYARTFTDFAHAAYLANLVVLENYKRTGIGRTLIGKTKTKLGDQVSLALLSSKEGLTYYPKVGFEKEENAYFIRRKY